MNIILLSGGSGKRLWPLSNDVRSKQFIKLFKNNDEYESMVQRVYRQITTVDADAKITIATSKSQASAIKNQLGEKASICVEPCRRDTFPAIALAAAYLHDELGVDENEAVVVCPVDPSMRAGEHMTYHMHNYREEVWTVVSGKGKAIVDGMEKVLRTGDVITIAAGCKHTIEAITALDMIEVQLGEEISVSDKVKFPME